MKDPDKIYLEWYAVGDERHREWGMIRRKDDAVEYIRKDYMAEKINELIKALERQNPDPFGDITQCLAASEIETLKIVLDTMDDLSKEN